MPRVYRGRKGFKELKVRWQELKELKVLPKGPKEDKVILELKVLKEILV